MRKALTLAGLVVGAALLLAAAGSPRGIKEGGTFRITTSFVGTIDPALGFIGPECGTLMGYPDKAPPEGLRLRPELAAAKPVVSRDGRTYRFTIRKEARFSDGKTVTARAFARALERIRDSALESFLAPRFQAIREVDATGKTLTLRLTKRFPGLLGWTTQLCAVPPNLPVDPEGAKAPLPSAAPYYAAQYVPGERLVLERNRFYKGPRVHHVERFDFTLNADPASAFRDIASGKFDCCLERSSDISLAAAELARRYGVNKPGGQFFVEPANNLRMFVLNTSRPLFRKNPKLRQAVNFAADRRAIARELGPYFARATDQYLGGMPGFRDERIYPLKGPDLDKARALARGHMRSGEAVLYAPNLPGRVAPAQVLENNLEALGLEVELVLHSPQLHFAKLARPGEPFDIADLGYAWPDETILNQLFDGRTIGQPGFANLSYFNSPRYNRLLEQASRLTGTARERAYGELDVRLSRDAAPAIPFANLNAVAFVSARVGCVVMNPRLDLTAVCLK